MSMHDRWTSDVHGGSPHGLPSSKWRFLKLSSRLFCLLGECARDLTKCAVCKKTLTLSQKRSRPALTYHELLSNFISRLDLDHSARISSACRIALTSSKCKQSAETFVDVSKHFQFSLFWNRKGTQILKKKHSKFERVGSKVRKSRCLVQQWMNICSTIFPAL